ncbi:flagellar protein FliS [Sphaerotilus hippei]|uniref:Flagellar secretion chaperone FliS n=1 Tax=Sphaerotilus hippei TaxID=744406 RepID=A0A318GUZ3_9BURK|nr:flagellar export chaperone FliS [Sphaerotilus hippei]PXW91930.1 flagellar protein FliS [Sphaerotilus hippei]
MFAQTSFRGSNSSLMLSGLYRQIGVETGVKTASAHQLVQMLYDGLLESIVQARGALASQDVEAKGRAVTRAARIVDEGLKAALSPAGGELTMNLSNLYGYITRRLMHAHLHNDAAALDECHRLVQPLRDAWAEIGAQVQA